MADLVNESTSVLQAATKDQMGRQFVNHEAYTKLLGNCRLICKRLGSIGDVWKESLPALNLNKRVNAQHAHGTLLSMQEAIEKGRLSTMQELVTAEVLSDLLEQAEVLLAAKYYRAAAIILRTILEERLRKLSETNGCLPTTAKPTIEHYKQALYAATIIDKIVQKKIDWMAGVGNGAAHNLPEYREEDVPILYKDTLDFLARFSA